MWRNPLDIGAFPFCGNKKYKRFAQLEQKLSELSASQQEKWQNGDHLTFTVIKFDI